MNMKNLIVFTLVVVVLGVCLQAGAVPVIPPIPTPTPSPTPAPGPSPGGMSILESQQKFQVITAQPALEGYAGSTIDYDIKVIQKGYPDLVVHVTADTPDKWKATFSRNDFDLTHEEVVVLKVSLSVPENASAEKWEITINAVGKAKDDSLEVKDSAMLTAVTYIIDVGIVNFQLSSLQPRLGENVTVTVTAVNYTQRIISDIVVEFLVNNNVVSKQVVTLPAGIFLNITFGWTAQEGVASLLVRSQTKGDFNRKNDTVTQKITIGSRTKEVDILYEQAKTLYMQEDYDEARNLFSIIAAQYMEMGELDKAEEANKLQSICNAHIEAQELMNFGEQAFLAQDYGEAAQYFEDARDLYRDIGDTTKENQVQQRLNEALDAQKPLLPVPYIVLVGGIVGAILLMIFMWRRYSPGERHSRYLIEEASPTGPDTDSGSAVSGDIPTLVHFHQKTEDALNRLTTKYVRDNFQQAMNVYLSLEEEKKQLPRNEDLELERAIEVNLRELEDRILGTH
jgi:tetratricopeptide (TPR) repeat protein